MTLLDSIFPSFPKSTSSADNRMYLAVTPVMRTPPLHADKLMSEREYTEMKRQYRSDMERAQARLDELEQRQKDERQQTMENPWLTACGQFREEQALTAAPTYPNPQPVRSPAVTCPKEAQSASSHGNTSLGGQFREEQALTADMAHALIERVEIDAENHVSITLRYRDEYNALLRLLAAEGGFPGCQYRLAGCCQSHH